METALKLLKFSTMTYVRLADSQISRDTLDVFVKQVGSASLALLTAKWVICLAARTQPLPSAHPAKVLHQREHTGSISSFHTCAALIAHIYRRVQLLLSFAMSVYCRTLSPSQDKMVLQAFKDYDLEQYGIFDEEHYKSRAIIAHGTASRTILVAFRGTSNIRNLHLDLRGWPTIWPWHRWRPSSPPQPFQWLPLTLK